MSRPEILAPAGDRPALAAALAAGADAVYFGLDDGFNARARAFNFASGDLASTILLVHRANARAFVTLNTLVFEPELPIVEELIRRVAAAGVDAIIVQDPAVALLARAICPALEVHASTQMTASSPLAAELLRPLGLTRVVVPRELSVDDIRAYAAGTSLPLEVFVHGALCVAWSGQCLSSEAWGGRSANRGQCAQACRLPYSLVVDDRPQDLGDVAYLLSPKDLSGVDAVPALADIGVASLKIEGRLKGPAYVATTVARYREASIKTSTEAEDGPSGDRWRSPVEIPVDDTSLEIAYSRGNSLGFLGGADHQTLVEGRFPRHRGRAVGRIVRVEPGAVVVERDAAQRPVTGGRAIAHASGDPASEPRTGDLASSMEASEQRAPVDGFVPRAGMGVVFDRGHPEQEEQGGPIFAVEVLGGGRVRLEFGRPGPDLHHVSVGDFVWVNSDPMINRAGDHAAEAGLEPLGRIPVALEVVGTAGAPLEVIARIQRRHAVGSHAAGSHPFTGGSAAALVRTTVRTDVRTTRAKEAASMGASDNGTAATRAADARATSSAVLQAARGRGLTSELLADKLGSFGGTAFHLGALETSGLAAGLHVPVSELKEIRRQLVTALDAVVARIDRVVATASVFEQLRREHHVDANADTKRTVIDTAAGANPMVVPLCRTDAQLDAVIAAGAREVELDWMELVGLAKAVSRARAAGLRIGIATVRVQKPGEERIDAHLARLEPDHVLVRSWGSLAYFAALANAPALHGDFSLNVTNSITAGWVLQRGLATVTAAHDLDRDQLFAMLDHVPRGRVAVTVHHHIPTFHTEHCVYAHLLSTGKDFKTCGRPCEKHEVALRDRVGLVHPVVVDVGCRNTVFNAQAQSAASLVPDLVERGVRRFRIELVRETAAEATRVYEAYRALVTGTITPADAVRRTSVHEQFGVTRGTMRTLTVLR